MWICDNFLGMQSINHQIWDILFEKSSEPAENEADQAY